MGLSGVHVGWSSIVFGLAAALALAAVCLVPVWAQDGTTAVEGLVEDLSGARIARAQVTIANPENGFRRVEAADAVGHFSFATLPPGRYTLVASAPGMSPAAQAGLELHVGGGMQVQFRLRPAGPAEHIAVIAVPAIVDPQTGEISQTVDEESISGLPLNGRRYTDLALLAPGVTQDPRGLTSSSNGDLSYGGVRGYQNSFLVDGADNNNAFFAQARGRYRAPYQFSNEVVREFRVSSNGYSAELGRAGGAVFNVVTKSGSNHWHGTGFYYLRDKDFDAQPAHVTAKPDERQQQYGGTFGGPLRRDRAFFYLGFDQHQLKVPAVLQFGNGASQVLPQPTDYNYLDQPLVQGAADKLNAQAGEYPTSMTGNAGLAKLDFNLSSRQMLLFRLSTSRYSGTNNVFFDASSPITLYAQTNNGTEEVETESLASSWSSAWTTRLTSSLRAQYSRDAQRSYANSDDPAVKIYGILAGMGRSSILPRQTRENKLHLADTFSYASGRMTWKFGGDFLQTWIDNYFPAMFGGQYEFYNLKVNPWFFTPMKYGQPLSPLRAYAHGVPRYYTQDFGTAESHPNSRNYSLFVQDGIRFTRSLTVNLGLRYDLQTFEVPGLVSNPLYPASGRVPTDTANFSPRAGFTYAIGDRRPWVIRGGYGRFYSLVPSIYASQVAIDNGLTQSELHLDLMKPADAALFPRYPNALVNCSSGTINCVAPPDLAGHLTSKVSAFAADFQTPYTEQASLTLEHGVGAKLTATASYLYVHGEHLIRSLDANLPKPKLVQYPIYNDQSVFTGDYYAVESFATWQTARTVDCPYPPCLNEVQRPDPRLGTINVFESAASSFYNGLTLLLKGQVNRELFLRVGYSFAKAIDDGQDALVVGRPGNVQNAYATQLERGLSVTDQRHRFVASAVYETRSFHYAQGWLNQIFNDWKFSSVVTTGSGRPINATMAGDPNGDNNTYNDRLPGASRNGYAGPNYFSADLRVSKAFHLSEGVRLNVMAESFNLTNRTNQRVNITDDGFLNSAGQFIAYSTSVGKTSYPGQFVTNSKFLLPTYAYAPRQVQLAVRLDF